ncbi:hypothetical protein [Aureimonas sp. Leaf454]|uniref:hypothetical protein n=1 Tax=Aureimonas sp. Leaf454 TaxID=1736381 RepID=UPI0012E36EBA|nr:hypothetical protein [Aureimonas sp. Leaf454]
MTLILAQIAMAGRAAAAMVAPDPLSIICTAHDGVQRPADPVQDRQCPCADLCQAGVFLPTPPAPSDDLGLPIRFADRVERGTGPAESLPAAPFLRRPRATGPPVSFDPI